MTAEEFARMPLDGPLGSRTRRRFEILGLRIDAIARRLGVEDSPRTKILPFYEVCAKLWGEDHPAFAKVLRKLRGDAGVCSGLGEDKEKWTNAVREQISAEAFASLSWTSEKGALSRRTFHVGGKGLRGIGRIFGIKTCAASSDEGFRELFVRVWGREHPAYELFPAPKSLHTDVLDTLGSDVSKWRAEIEKLYTVEQFVSLNQVQRYELKVAGLGWFAISSRLGGEDSRYRIRGFLEMCAKLWGEDHPAIRERLDLVRRASERRSALLSEPEGVKTILRESCTRERFVSDPHAYRAAPRLAGLGPVTFGKVFGVTASARWTKTQREEIASIVWGPQ
jgi:hypothetical protein